MKSEVPVLFHPQNLLSLISVALVFGREAVAAPASMNTTLPSDYGMVSKIVFAADNEGSVFVNGVRKASVSQWNQVAHATVRLSYGDVVAIKASDLGVWYGVIVDIEYDGAHHGTGISDWKAVKKFDLVGIKNKDAWMLKEYSSCGWPAAQVRPRENDYFAGKAKEFPTVLDAKYVWASNAGEKDTIFMRYVVGGEKCPKSGISPPPTPLNEADKTDQQQMDGPKRDDSIPIEGQSEESGTESCPCKISPGPRGVCWVFYEEGGTRCYPRDCEDKYECVPSDESSPMTCIRRWATEKVMPDLRNGGNCLNVATPPTMFYSLYAE